MMKTPKILISAIRQYFHNDRTGLVIGFDYDTTIEIVKDLKAKNKELENWIKETLNKQWKFFLEYMAEPDEKSMTFKDWLIKENHQDAVLRLIQNDSHHWSNRPCETCRTISSIIDKPFGCYEWQRLRKQKNGE